MSDFDSALASFYEGCQRINETHRAEYYPRTAPATWRLERLKKRARVVCNSSCHCFVDYATGDVLKSSGWDRPADHARGNIFDDANGLGAMGPYGPAYLR
jgi:hypothetical protein